MALELHLEYALRHQSHSIMIAAVTTISSEPLHSPSWSLPQQISWMWHFLRLDGHFASICHLIFQAGYEDLKCHLPHLELQLSLLQQNYSSHSELAIFVRIISSATAATMASEVSVNAVMASNESTSPWQCFKVSACCSSVGASTVVFD